MYGHKSCTVPRVKGLSSVVSLLFLLLFLGAAGAQAIRGMSEQQTSARKPDLTEGGGNSTVGATRPALPQDSRERFEALDLDGDGRVSLAEAAGHAEVVTGFDRADRNRDGRLSLAEFRNLGKKPAAEKPRRPKATARTAPPGSSTAGTSSASTR
jgi:hypothetical protein